MISTAVDYVVMVTCVEAAKIGPVAATAIGATGGAVTNFTMNRTFTYRAADVAMKRQLWKFALVSAASLGWNTLGEYLLHSVAGLHYFPARVITSIIVSNVWNYPMLRFFVFSNPTARV